jgi:hypothetical protein
MPAGDRRRLVRARCGRSQAALSRRPLRGDIAWGPWRCRRLFGPVAQRLEQGTHKNRSTKPENDVFPERYEAFRCLSRRAASRRKSLFVNEDFLMRLSRQPLSGTLQTARHDNRVRRHLSVEVVNQGNGVVTLYPTSRRRRVEVAVTLEALAVPDPTGVATLRRACSQYAS